MTKKPLHQDNLKDRAKIALKIGYGLSILSLDKAHQIAKHVKTQLDLDDKESTRLAKEIVKKSKKASDDVLGKVSEHVEKAILDSGLATKRELKYATKTLRNRIKEKLTGKKETRWEKIKKKVLRKK